MLLSVDSFMSIKGIILSGNTYHMLGSLRHILKLNLWSTPQVSVGCLQVLLDNRAAESVSQSKPCEAENPSKISHNISTESFPIVYTHVLISPLKNSLLSFLCSASYYLISSPPVAATPPAYPQKCGLY